MALRFNILTLFPQMFPSILEHSLSGKALERGIWDINVVNIRDFASGVHKSVDDTPYGGGAGMVLKPDVVSDAASSIENSGRRIYLSPRGRVLTQSLAQELSQEENITLLCGRYEGVDQRALDVCGFEEVSIGDYVLSGGEAAALVLMDSCIRLLPDVMGNKETVREESFTGGLLEYPHYTRPCVWRDQKVPDVLLSGDHAKIAKWRREKSLELTKSRRPDLLREAK